MARTARRPKSARNTNTSADTHSNNNAYTDETALIAAAQGGDRAAIQQLINRHYGFVVATASRHARGVVELEDLIQEGIVGLIEGLSRFDPKHERVSSLLTFLAHWIERSMRRANVRDDHRYGARLPEDLYYAIGRRRQSERRRQGDSLGLDRATAPADARVGPEMVRQVEQVRSITLLRLDAPHQLGEPSIEISRDDTREPLPLRELTRAQEADELRRAVQSLPRKHREFITKHYDLSEQTGRSRRGSNDRQKDQLHSEALSLLRQQLRSIRRP